MPGKTKESERHIGAVLAALDVLDCLGGQSPVTVAEISRRTGFHRSRVMRIVGTLSARGYLLQDPETGAVAPGPQLMVLGKSYERSHTIIGLARPVLRELADRTGESASLFVREGTERVVLVREESTLDLRFSVAEGQRMPLHAGASGKVLLAFGPERIRRQYIGKKTLDALTPGTITDPGALDRELRRIQKRGYAVSRAERIADVGAVAAPVFGGENRLIGAIGIAGPASRYGTNGIRSFLQQVVRAAAELSRSLGGSPVRPEEYPKDTT